ncbi:MAG TPA: hypothetical protein VH542_00200 [Steroidobacteraceae bacterium]|jgi:hypothetical protein
MGRIVPGTDAKATVTVTSNGNTVVFNNVPVTVEADGRVRFVMPKGRIVPGTDAKITINFRGNLIESPPLTVSPGGQVTFSASGAAVA